MSISAVIPAHNAARFIEEAIRSVQAQTLQVSEIIVVADACTDRTAQIAAGLGANVLEHNKRSVAASLNVGVKTARHPWIAFLDADDLWKKSKLAYQWKAIESCPAAALVACDHLHLQNQKAVSLPARALRERWNNINSVKINGRCRFVQNVEGNFLPRFDLLSTTVMLRRDVFERVGFLDETLFFGQTLEFFARVLTHCPLAFVEKPLAYHRRHENNHTADLAAYWPMYVSIIDRMVQRPNLYPKGAGEAYRTRLKTQFHQFERALVRHPQSTSNF